MTMASALLLAAGCAHEEQSVQNEDSSYSSGRMSEYNNSYTTPPVGGSYSADGSYSSGGGGSYSSNPKSDSGNAGNYSGTVRADGSYIPNTPADSSLVGAAYSGSSGPESDNAMIAQVRESLRQDPEIAVIASNIQISAHNGAILLNGSCQSEEQKRQILAKVQTVAGVVAVNNQLNVMAGPNVENPNGSQLVPTGNDSQRLYKDVTEGQDDSTNNALNSTSRPNGPTQIYQNNPGEKVPDTNSVPQMP